LIVPAHVPDVMSRCESSDADVIVLDLEYTVPPKHKVAARAGLAQLVKSLADKQREVFVRIDRDTRWADVRAGVARGIRGIVHPGPESAEEVAEIDALIADCERTAGVEPGRTEIAIMLESARGFLNAAAIAQASGRVTALGIGRAELAMQLGPVPQGEFRLYRYLMTRTVVAARMLRKQPLGAHWRPGSRGGVAGVDATAQAAREGRLMGFTGCVCAEAAQVQPVNAAFGGAR
jgi:citrate lyase subunit beta/citryl-CoA lyase